jgi:hypothetical protein
MLAVPTSKICTMCGAEGRHGGGKALGVGALEDWRDLVGLLAVVEAFGQTTDPLAELTAHRVPPLDLHWRLGLRRGGGKGGQGAGGQDEMLDFHVRSTAREKS